MNAPTAEGMALLARCGLADAPLSPLAGDASPRRYFRLQGRALLLMEYQGDPAGFAAYLRVTEHLASLGLSAPRVTAADAASGVALVEDFGDRSYTACLAAGEEASALYHLALDALLHLHHHERGGAISLPAYDMEALLRELDVFSHWFAPAVAPPQFARDAFARQSRALWRAALLPVAARFESLVLRDFHIDNLMLLPQREGVARCGLLDFQDAFLGPCEYDLVSLLQDARCDLPAGLEQALFARYVADAPKGLGGKEAIRQRCALLGAQRHGRILGVFVRLWRRDGKARYLGLLPRVLRQFRTALEAAGLDEIRRFLDAELPDWEAKALSLKNHRP